MWYFANVRKYELLEIVFIRSYEITNVFLFMQTTRARPTSLARAVLLATVQLVSISLHASFGDLATCPLFLFHAHSFPCKLSLTLLHHNTTLRTGPNATAPGANSSHSTSSGTTTATSTNESGVKPFNRHFVRALDEFIDRLGVSGTCLGLHSCFGCGVSLIEPTSCKCARRFFSPNSHHVPLRY